MAEEEKKKDVSRRKKKSPSAMEYWARNRQESYRPLEPHPVREHEENWQDWLDRGHTVMDSPAENFLRDLVNKIGMVVPIPRDMRDVAETAAIGGGLKVGHNLYKKGRNLYNQYKNVKAFD
jgi:hypothetical protein